MSTNHVLTSGKLPLVLEQVWALIHLKDVGIEEIEQGLTLHLELLNSPTYQVFTFSPNYNIFFQ